MSNFSITRNGYTPQEVDSHINRLNAEYERALGEQKDRIFEMSHNVRQLEEQLLEYRRKDEEISSALLSAVKKAKEIEKEAEERYENELSRLKTFHNKWVKYYNEIKQRYPIDDDLISVENFLLEMNKILGSDVEISESTALDQDYIKKRQEFISQYQSERNRIGKDKPNQNQNSSEKRFMSLISSYDGVATAEERPRMSGFKPMEKIGQYIASTASNKPQVSDSGFDLNEVLNPSGKLDLGDICRELGLMENEDKK